MLKLVFNGGQTNISLHFRSLLLYSTASTTPEQATHFMVDILANSLGFSREEAVAALETKKVSRLKSPENPISVIRYFKQIGLSQSQIKTIILKDVSVLSMNVDKTLMPKIRVFQDLGLSGSDLGTILGYRSTIITRKLETHIQPLIQNLRSILGSDKNVAMALRRSYLLASVNFPKQILPSVNLLKSYGLSDERIAKFIINNPWNVICPLESLEKTLRFVEKELGINRGSGMFIYGIDVFCSSNKDTLELKYRVFKSYGWTESDIMTMARKLPNCLKLSVSKIKKGLDFFMKELGYSPEYIASHPNLLMYSLQNRVLARREFWKELTEKKLYKHSRWDLYSVLCIPEQRFLDKYVLPYQNELPALCDTYINKISASRKKLSVG